MTRLRSWTVPVGALLVASLALVAAPQARADATAEVRGTITTKEGKPLEGVVIEFTAIGMAYTPFKGKSRKDGTFVFPFLPFLGKSINWGHTYTLAGYRVRGFHVVSRAPQTAADKGAGMVFQDDTGSSDKVPPVVVKPGGNIKIDITMVTDAEFDEAQKARAAAAAAQAAAESPQPAASAVPTDPLGAARALAAAGKADEAKETLKTALATDPTADKWAELGRLQAATDDSASARMSYGKAAALDPSLKGAHLAIGKLYADDGRTDEAIAELEKERALQPADPGTLRALASLYAQAGRRDEAIQIYEALTAGADANADTLSRLAVLYREAGNTKKAEETYARIAAANPKDADQVYYRMGRAIMDQNVITDADRGRAADAFKRAIAANPKNALAHKELGYVLLGSGDLAGAKSHLKEFLSLKPDDKDAAEVRGMLKDLG